MRCCRPCWIRQSKVNYDGEGTDPKGFLWYRSPCQAEWFCLSGRRSSGETFRVSDGDGQRASEATVCNGRCLIQALRPFWGRLDTGGRAVFVV
jgi:hypothetical protein